MMILEHPTTKERVVTASRDGYPDWKLIEDNVSSPPGHAERVDGRWRKDQERGKQTSIEELKAEIEELRERLNKLEGPTDGGG